MRRSSVVRLTLLPILATAAVAAAQPGLQEPGLQDPEPEPLLAPPSMTPTIRDLDCDHDPNWELRPDCVNTDDGVVIVRGGFGSYFWSAGG